MDVRSIKWSEEGEQESSTDAAMGLGFLLSFITYMFVLMYGAMIMNSVIEEKTNRIVEVVVSSCRPFQLMLGKIIGVGLVGLTQMAIWIVLLGIVGTIAGSSFGLSGMTTGSVPPEAMAAAQDSGFMQDVMKQVLSINYVPIILNFIIYFLGVKLRAVKFFTGSVRNAMISAILITAIYQLGGLSRVVRNAFREEMRKSYVRFAISRGFSREYVLYRHASRPVLCTLIGAVIANFAWVFGGSTVLEFAFTIPGVSYFLVDSMQSSDYTVLQTDLLVVVIWMFCVHAVLNLVLYALDVRRRA